MRSRKSDRSFSITFRPSNRGVNGSIANLEEICARDFDLIGKRYHERTFGIEVADSTFIGGRCQCIVWLITEYLHGRGPAWNVLYLLPLIRHT